MEARKPRVTVFLPDRLHEQVQERGTGRIFATGEDGHNVRPYAILPGGVLTAEGWEHTVVPEDEMMLAPSVASVS